MEIVIIIVLLVVLLALLATLLAIWIGSIRKNLVNMDDNVKNAMGQIGVQLASRFDVLSVLLTLVKGYAGCEAVGLMNTLLIQRNDITAISTPEDVLGQEGVISEALESARESLESAKAALDSAKRSLDSELELAKAKALAKLIF